VALPLLPQLGLEPNVYYIPPVHVGNLAFLRMLFGPGVERAIAAYRRAMAGEDPELVGVLLLAVSTDRIVHKFSLRGDHVYGYGEDGSELVRVPLKEPVQLREFYDPLVGAYRYNIT